MRIETLPGVDRAISLEDFLDRAGNFDPYDPESTWAMREPLAALALNRTWLFEAVTQSLRKRLASPWAREQPSYFVLHNCPTFGLRANIWLPERKRAQAVLENAAFSYDFPHDHNFDILSVTCFGSGYETDIYTYGGLSAAVAIDDIVEVEPLGRRRLSPGTAFMYEACRDVHTQLPADDITVTLNFLPLRLEDHARPQLIFEVLDERHLRVMGVPLSPEGRELSAIRMLAKLASVSAGDPAGLRGIAAEHPNQRVRDYAEAALRRLRDCPDEIHREQLREIDRDNVAFKYHEVAEVSRAKQAA